MVIRTEYRDQRYSMGSSDPLPAGFEIRFGSLNFQATGNSYLMRITNRNELQVRRQTGGDPASAAPAARDLASAQVDVVGPSALRRRRCSGQRSRQARTERRRDHRRDGNRSDGGTHGFGATLPHRSARRHYGVRRLRQHLSVRNVVPTLTSNKRQGLSLNGRC
jgi:hypothetical protein